MSAWLVNLGGILLIGFIVWWFWLSRPASQKAASDLIEIVVENGVYTPARIEIPANRAVTLRFLRKDATPCAEKVVFDALGITEDLPLGQPRDIRLPPRPPGEVEFTCQMQMYRGTLVVSVDRQG
jgi:plastocyanin domain-containing protein